MKAGIIGLPASGKTTLFNLLTRGHAETRKFGGSDSAPNLGVTNVPDPRLDFLSNIYKPKKTTPATVEFVDVAGMAPGGAKEKGFSAQLLTALRGVDALIHVVRAFDDPSVPHPEGPIHPTRDAESLELEIAFADLAVIDKRLSSIESDIAKRRNFDKVATEKERVLLLHLKAHIEAEQPLRTLELTRDESASLRGYTFLSQKPMLLVLNTGESGIGQKPPADLNALAEKQHMPALALCAQIEMEIAQMDDADAQAFLQEMGIAESGRDRLIRLAYQTLDLISFFTVGPDECRAWTITRGDTALIAAGKVHSDIARGFIRAEVITYEKLREHGSWNAAREKGQMRLEGKEYVMEDGDCMSVRFNV